MEELAGMRALVCGGSRGIGRACAIELACRGAEVTVVARTEDTLKDTVASLDRQLNQRHALIRADSTDPEGLRARVAKHIEDTAPMQILINNTGGPPPGLLIDAEPAQLADAFASHVLCAQLLARMLIGGMKEAGYGRIINIISTSVFAPIRGLGVSNTIRGAMANWGRTLAGELAPFGITVNNILPGYTATDRLMSLFEHQAREARTDVRAVAEAAAETVPAGRLGQPEELAAVVAFLASPSASYLNGVNIPVDGGRTARQ